MMNEQARSIFEEIFSDEAGTPEKCRQCRSYLYALIDAELIDGTPGPEFSAVRKHLETCEDCQAEYEDLKMLLLLEAQGKLVDPASEGTFDFEYLDADASRPQLWELFQTARGETRRLIQEVRVRLGQAGLAIEAITGAAAAEMVPLPATRAQTDQEVYAGKLELPVPDLDLHLTLLVIPVEPDGFIANLEVLTLSGKQPVDRVRITGRTPHGGMLFSQLTGPNGQAQLPQLGAESVLLELRYRQTNIELPISFTSVHDA